MPGSHIIFNYFLFKYINLTTIHIKDKIDFFHVLFYLICHNKIKYGNNHFILYFYIKYTFISILYIYCFPVSIFFSLKSYEVAKNNNFFLV